MSNRQQIELRAKEIFKTFKANCQYGGCHNHGQEFCDLAAAWEDAVDIAKDEAFQKEEVQNEQETL